MNVPILRTIYTKFSTPRHIRYTLVIIDLQNNSINIFLSNDSNKPSSSVPLR